MKGCFKRHPTFRNEKWVNDSGVHNLLDAYKDGPGGNVNIFMVLHLYIGSKQQPQETVFQPSVPIVFRGLEPITALKL
ncbi:unnamed protein product [Caretta caretta]